jgi:hypothetical protein
LAKQQTFSLVLTHQDHFGSIYILLTIDRLHKLLQFIYLLCFHNLFL